MVKKRKKSPSRHGLQTFTLCMSTTMVLVLLGIVVFSVLTARNLSNYVKENIVVTLTLQDDMTQNEAQVFCKKLGKSNYVGSLEYISKEQALKEGTKALGANPSEFIGANPFSSSIELRLKADYANNDSLANIAKQLKRYPKVNKVAYQKDLIEQVNRNMTRIGFVLLALAALLTIVSFTLINNTVRLSVYARRFSIHTMKLVGASWGFIRAPFLRQAAVLGLLASVLAMAVLAGCGVALCYYEPEVAVLMTWREAAITGGSILCFGLVITLICSLISVNKFLRMKAGDLYKI